MIYMNRLNNIPTHIDLNQPQIYDHKSSSKGETENSRWASETHRKFSNKIFSG